MMKLIKDKIKLPKISVDTAYLYEKVGFGTITNELPFMCRVQHELRLKGINIWIESHSLKSFSAHISIPKTKMSFVEEKLSSWEIAMDLALQEALKTLIH